MVVNINVTVLFMTVHSDWTIGLTNELAIYLLGLLNFITLHKLVHLAKQAGFIMSGNYSTGGALVALSLVRLGF
jgi:hypothetical protein